MFSSVDSIWVLFGAVLVFSMQIGFTMVEVGLTRLKNSGNIIMKNVMDLCLGSVAFWFIGFGIMFGTDLVGLVGIPDFLFAAITTAPFPPIPFNLPDGVLRHSGHHRIGRYGRTHQIQRLSDLQRSHQRYYLSHFRPLDLGRRLAFSQLGFHDFAGSTAVHMVGGVAALVGAKILGPRIGKYDAEKENLRPFRARACPWRP